MSIDVSQKAKLILCLDKPSHLRTSDDLDVIYNCLKLIKSYSGLHPYLLQQMCLEVQYEHLKERIVVYQGGKPEKNCYVVMSGSLIIVERDNLPEILNQNFHLRETVFQPLITEGCAFGNNFRLNNNNHQIKPFSINLLDSKAVVTQEDCELLYMDQKIFQEIWSKNEKFLRDLNLSRDISVMDNNVRNMSIETGGSSGLPDDANMQNLSVPVRTTNPGHNPSIINAAFFIYKSSKSLLVSLPSNASSSSTGNTNTGKIGSAKSTSQQVMIGEDMVSWMKQLIKINSRLLAIGIWQVLLEECILVSLTSPYCLRDSANDYYVFVDDFYHGCCGSSGAAGNKSIQTCDDLETAVNYLMKPAPDALFRMILHKSSKERNKEEFEFIYGELLHIKALSHLSSMVKRQLSSVLMYEIHPFAGKMLFYQGSEGNSWYIIVKGSVDVHIKGKGVVCRLRTNDDFGKLALVNNSPRAASIILRENDCHFLKIDKEDFNRILRDVEINTVRLTEHGKDVLLFEKRITDSPGRKSSLMPAATNSSGYYMYSVMAGTPEKIIDHLLENRIDTNKSYASILDRVGTIPDPMLETFILTYFAFLTNHGLCSLLLVYFQNFNDQMSNEGRATPIEDKEHEKVVLLRKTRVIHFLYWWCRISDGAFFEDHVIQSFTENLLNVLSIEKKSSSTILNKEFLALNCLLEQFQKTEMAASKKISQRGKFSKHHQTASKNSTAANQQLIDIPPIKGKDLTTFTVYFASNKSCILRLPVDSTVQQIIETVAKHENIPVTNLCLCEVKSDGERVVFDMDDVGIMYNLSVNGRIFLMNYEEYKENCFDERDDCSPSNSKSESNNIFDSTSIDELAFHMTYFDWQLFKNIHVYELLFKVLGRSKFGRITANLDSFIRQFTNIQYWVVTEICQCQNAQRRVNIVKKMIKLASRLSELKNISSSFAVLMGLNNSAVARLQLTTWDRLSNKHRKLFQDLCSLLDPTRNHCAFRQYLKKTPPPIIPFFAIMLKDLTFINEANKTYFDDNMINFEKMQMYAASMHQFLHCRARPMIFENSTSMKRDKLSNSVDLQNFVRGFKCHDDQKVLTQMSLGIEAKQPIVNNNSSPGEFGGDNVH